MIQYKKHQNVQSSKDGMRESTKSNIYQMTACVAHRILFLRTRLTSGNRKGKFFLSLFLLLPLTAKYLICKTCPAPRLSVLLPVPPCHDPCVREPWNLIIRQTFSSQCCRYFLEWQLAQSGTRDKNILRRYVAERGPDAEKNFTLRALFLFCFRRIRFCFSLAATSASLAHRATLFNLFAGLGQYTWYVKYFMGEINLYVSS